MGMNSLGREQHSRNGNSIKKCTEGDSDLDSYNVSKGSGKIN